MKISQLGWVLAATTVGLGIGGGFQTKTDKTGFVNMVSVFDDSNLKKKNDDRLHTVEMSRIATLDFLGLFPEFNATQLARFHDLSIIDSPTPAEANELAKLKADAQTSSKQYDELRTKQNPSPTDVATLNDLGERNRICIAARTSWGNEFDQELRKMQNDLDAKSIDAIKAAIAQAAKAQGLTLVFRENVAIYGSRDLGPEVKKISDKNAK